MPNLKWSALLSRRSNFRFAARSLARHPIVLVAGIASFALGTGATTTVLSVVDALYLRPPIGVSHPDRVAHLAVPDARSRLQGLPGTAGITSYRSFVALRSSLPALPIAGESSARPLLAVGDMSVRVHAQLVSSNYFALLGVYAAYGRLIDGRDAGIERADPVIVLSHALWQSQFAGQPNVVGSSIRVNGDPFTVIGIAPKGFNGVAGGTVDFWVPLGVAGQVGFQADALTSPQARWVDMIVCRPSAMTSQQLELLVATAAAQTGGYSAARANLPQVHLSPIGAPLTQATWANAASSHLAASMVLALGIFSFLIFVIACTNVAHLLLVHGVQRRHEIAIRRALGAQSHHIAALVGTECVILALGGGACGLLLVAWGQRLIRLIPGPPQPIVYDWRTSAACIAITLISAFLAGLLPVIRISRSTRVAHLLTDSVSQNPRRQRLGEIMQVLQISLAFVLLVGAALTLHSVYELQHVDTGMTLDRVLVVMRDSYAGPPRTANALDTDLALTTLRDRIARIPGVDRASLAMGAPFLTTFQARVTPSGGTASQYADVEFDAIDSGYFRTLGIPVRRGRSFVTADMIGDQPVAVINEELARTLWPYDDAVGKCFQWDVPAHPCCRVVGVVRNTLYGGLTQAPNAMFYIPVSSSRALAFRSILVRTSGPAEQMVQSVADVLQAAPGEMRRYTVEPLASANAPEIADARIRAAALTCFSIVALTMVALGLFGSVSYSTSQRAREIALRIALGADSTRVRRMVVRRSLAIAAAGVALGAMLAALLSTLMDGIMFKVSHLDALAYAAVTGLIVVTTLVAAYIPAYGASKASPMPVLRS